LRQDGEDRDLDIRACVQNEMSHLSHRTMFEEPGDLRARQIAPLENVEMREPWIFLPPKIGKNTFCSQVRPIRRTETESAGRREVILSTSRSLELALDTDKETNNDRLEPIWTRRPFFLGDSR
jgi:hypothetical protein